MYVLLNLKDDKMLQNVVQLLFSHGHRQLSIGESIENLCPTCDKSNGISVDTSPVPEFMCSTPIKPEGCTNGKSCLKRPYDNVSPILPTRIPEPKYEEVSVKEEPSEEGLDDQDLSGDVDDDIEDMTLSQALELFEAARNVGEPKLKKPKMEEPFGEMYQCQLCKKSISRHGQYANLLNHLSRHARLHASKKQYCCPKCGASFTRRYLASTHIKDTHNEPKLQPHDFAAELREEYRRLLEMCFPGADQRRKQQQAQQAQSQSNKDSTLSILSDDSGVSLNDATDLNITPGDGPIEVHVGNDPEQELEDDGDDAVSV